MPTTGQSRPEAESLHIPVRLDFCRSCLQSMTSRNTAVYRYHGIFERCMRYYRLAFRNTAHPYCRGTARRAMLVKLCYVSRGTAVREISNSKSDLLRSFNSRPYWQRRHSICYIRFPVSVPLQLRLDLAPLTQYCHLFPKLYRGHLIHVHPSRG